MEKKILAVLACLSLAFTAFADNERVIPFEQMPQKAQTFTRQYFPAEKNEYRQAYVTYDPEFLDSSYTVVFTTGDGIEFTKDGEWKDFECRMCTVPAEIIPAPIQAYLTQNFPDVAVKKIDRDKREIEVKLANGFELKFNTAGVLLEVDND